MNAHVNQLTATEKSKAAIAALVTSALMTDEKALQLLALNRKIRSHAQNAQDSSLLAFHEIKGNLNFESAEYFHEKMREDLAQIKACLVELGGLLK